MVKTTSISPAAPGRASANDRGSRTAKLRLLYFSPSSYGGLADYSHEQAEALRQAGVDVTLLCGPSFLGARCPNYRVVPRLIDRTSTGGGSRLQRALRFARLSIGNIHRLAETVVRENHRHVLLGSYAEYFAPFWAPRLRRLAQRGVVFGAILHDPIRDTVLGPQWWHRRSVAEGYSFLRNIFVHEPVSRAASGIPQEARLTVIPHGLYRFPTSPLAPEHARARYGLPARAPVLLSFGHVRDAKNLHLVIPVLRDFPDVHLLVAGLEQSGSQRPVSFYRSLASRYGVADRCRWDIRHIPHNEVAACFAAGDYALLTYSGVFRSASGVLSTAVHFEKPCLATSGPGPLRTAVEDYRLGVWREPDKMDAIADGLSSLLHDGVEPDWHRYRRENSWLINATAVRRALLAS